MPEFWEAVLVRLIGVALGFFVLAVVWGLLFGVPALYERVRWGAGGRPWLSGRLGPWAVAGVERTELVNWARVVCYVGVSETAEVGLVMLTEEQLMWCSSTGSSRWSARWHGIARVEVDGDTFTVHSAGSSDTPPEKRRWTLEPDISLASERTDDQRYEDFLDDLVRLVPESGTRRDSDS
jgi:hypothetical protein